MQLDSSSHKAFLYKNINFDKDGRFRQYPLDKLDVAMSASKKIAERSKTEGSIITFNDGETKFTAEEWVFLKEIVNEIKEATLEEGKIIKELKDLFSK